MTASAAPPWPAVLALPPLGRALTARTYVSFTGQDVAALVLNRWTARHRARLILTDGEAHWRLPQTDPARAALAVVALDAVATLGGHHDGVIKSCEQRTCAGLFVDTSRGRRRRWCSMTTCGKKVKKANLKAAQDSAEVGRKSQVT